MSSPGSQGSQPPVLPGAQTHPLTFHRPWMPTVPELQPRAQGPGMPRAPGSFQSSFSVESILARPDPCARVCSRLPVSHSAAPHFWTALSAPPARASPWVCPATWPPACLSLGVYPLCPQPSVPRLQVSYLCSPQGPSVTGSELARWSGFPDPAPRKGLKDTTEKHQKRVRTMFNLEQLEKLEKTFAEQHNVVGKKRAQLAAQLHLTETQVRIWFQNRRVKYQKQQKQNLPATSAMAVSLDEPSSSSDPSIQDEDAESGAES